MRRSRKVPFDPEITTKANNEYSLAFLPKVEITLYVADIRVEEVLKTIIDTARSGRMGDGKIMVLDVAEGI